MFKRLIVVIAVLLTVSAAALDASLAGRPVVDQESDLEWDFGFPVGPIPPV